MNETLRTINSKSAFIGKSGVRVVINPNGTRSLAARVNSNIPKNILNMANKNTFPGHLHVNRHPSGYTIMNATRRYRGRMTHNWERYKNASRSEIIRFIMLNNWSDICFVMLFSFIINFFNFFICWDLNYLILFLFLLVFLVHPLSLLFYFLLKILNIHYYLY
jgi:hypothetical protein